MDAGELGVLGVIIALLGALAGNWLRFSRAQSALTKSEAATVEAVQEARDIEVRSARAQVAALAAAEHDRRVAEKAAEERAAVEKADTLDMTDKAAVEAARRLAEERGW